MEPRVKEKDVSIPTTKSWSEIQKEESTFFNNHWLEAFEQGEIALKVPPDDEMYQQDLGHSLKYMRTQMGIMKNARIIDLGCGLGDYSIFIARQGAYVDAVDLAPSALEITQQRAAASGVEDRVRTHLMGAEDLNFADETFDLAVGFGILHHADLAQIGPEIRRVLKPRTKALFREPLGTNPLLQFGRRYLPYYGKYHSRHERPLTYEDIALMGQAFDATDVREFYLFSSISRLLGSEKSPIVKGLWALDEALFRLFPFLRAWSRYVVIDYHL